MQNTALNQRMLKQLLEKKMLNGEKISSSEDQNNQNTEWDSLKEVEFSSGTKETKEDNEDRERLTNDIMEKLDSSPRKTNMFKKALMAILLSAVMIESVSCAVPEKAVTTDYCIQQIEEYNEKVDDETWKINITNKANEIISIDNDNFEDYEAATDGDVKSIEAFLWSEEDGCIYHAIDDNGNGEWNTLSEQDLKTGKETEIPIEEVTLIPMTSIGADGRPEIDYKPIIETSEEASLIMSKLPDFSK